MKSFYITIALIFSIACGSSDVEMQTVVIKGNNTEIYLNNYIKIVIPTRGEKFDSCKHYTHIEVWSEHEKVFQDTSESEYMFLCNSNYTFVRNLDYNRNLLLIEKFDGPDIDKTLAIYLNDGKFEKKEILPFFESPPNDEDSDGKLEFVGIMNTIDGYSNGDSCYYNPTLYYETTPNGILLDSSLTKNKIIKTWGKFYGFEQSDKFILPCKTD